MDGMTNTENTINISFYDADAEDVTAAYFQMEDGWVTFKSAEHKAVAAYPAARVNRIRMDPPAAAHIQHRELP